MENKTQKQQADEDILGEDDLGDDLSGFYNPITVKINVGFEAGSLLLLGEFHDFRAFDMFVCKHREKIEACLRESVQNDRQ